MSKRTKISHDRLALERHGKLFRLLPPDLQQEILFDIEHEMLEGRNNVVITDRSLIQGSSINAVSGGEFYTEGETGSKGQIGSATKRRSKRHGHNPEGIHLPIEGGQ